MTGDLAPFKLFAEAFWREAETVLCSSYIRLYSHMAEIRPKGNLVCLTLKPKSYHDTSLKPFEIDVYFDEQSWKEFVDMVVNARSETGSGGLSADNLKWEVCNCETDFDATVVCGCGKHEIRMYRDYSWHFLGKHWLMSCIADYLKDMLVRCKNDKHRKEVSAPSSHVGAGR